MKKIFALLILCSITSVIAQNKKSLALEKGMKAIELMDKGSYEESIKLLEESEKLDPKNYSYPYEIAYAHVLQEDYEPAIKILEKTKKYKKINSQVYQLLGNCYDYLGKPEKAISTYEEGMKKFPNVGNLHLEKGNVYYGAEKYDLAIENYKNGLRADPMFPSNYYRLALLYLNSNDKLSGLIYGELFMNIERTTARTQEISKLLFNTYKNSITLGENESEIDFCDIIIDASEGLKKDFDLPFCAIFGQNFILSILGQTEINLSSLSSIRTQFLKNYYKEDYKKYPNVLFEYHKELMDLGYFEAYNHYLFQIGASEDFSTWKEQNQNKFDQFTIWYTEKNNIIDIKHNNLFIN